MRRTSVFVTVAFLAGLAISFFVRSAGIDALRRSNTRAADLAAIKKLEQEDIKVTLSQDPKGLVDVWAEDGVRRRYPFPDCCRAFPSQVIRAGFSVVAKSVAISNWGAIGLLELKAKDRQATSEAI